MPNYIAIADQFYERVKQIEKELPDDLKLGYAMDTTTTIRKAITEVEETILIAFGLVVVVIFVFLRDWRTTLIPAVAIPISLIGTFFIMYFAGFSINILTLLGIVLATGLVVDDAIVVLENIYQKIENGMSPRKAAHAGASEIYFAIISTTVTLAAVFLPIIFLEGVTGRLFREFGVVVAGAVLISAFVSLTLTPMMSSLLLKKKEKTSRFYEYTERFFTGLTNNYNRILQYFMKHRWIAIVVMVVSFGGIVWIGSLLPSELAPLEDKSRVRIFTTAPEGTSYELMDEYMMQMLSVVDTMPERESIIAVTSPGFGSSTAVNTSFVRITLKQPSEREKSQQEIAQELTKLTKEMNFARSFVTQEQTIEAGRSGGLPVQYVIQAPNMEKLKEVLPKFMERANEDPAFEVVDLDLKFNKPELAVTIDRERAQSFGCICSGHCRNYSTPFQRTTLRLFCDGR